MDQRSDEWLIARLASLGASKIGMALERQKRSGERMKAAQDYMYELAAERVTGMLAKRVNPLQWGVDHEDEARLAYTLITNLPVVQIALLRHPTIPGAHASPDALVGDDGGLEIKCPTSATHLKTLHLDAIPEDHLPQIFWNMACSGRAWWDFVSYDPRFPPEMQFFQRRVHRDEKVIARMEDEARAFNAELEAIINETRARHPSEAA